MLKILIVDNNLNIQKSAKLVLSEQFECVTTALDEHAVTLGNEFKPDIVIIDIDLADPDKQSPFEKITHLNCGKRVFTIYTSQNDDTDVKIRAYDAGGHDFLKKPFSEKELLKKMASFSIFIEERNTLINNAQDTQSLAMTSMKQASHYGYIMNFFKNLFHSSTAEEVAVLFFEAMDYWNLKACLALRLEEDIYFNGPNDIFVNPIERKIFRSLKDAGRLYAFSNRLLVNDVHASFLVKNMPKDEVEAGEVRDIVAAIIEGLEAKVIDLKRQAGLNLVTSRLSQTILNVQNGVNTHNQLISAVITDMMGSVASSFHTLELTENQETFFHDLFEKSGERIMKVEEVLLDIQDQLSTLSDQVSAIIEDTQEQRDEPVTSTTLEVELF